VMLGAAWFPRVQSIDRQTPKNNVVAFAKAATVFKIVLIAVSGSPSNAGGFND
jgi:hypothetical protein